MLQSKDPTINISLTKNKKSTRFFQENKSKERLQITDLIRQT
jgi:hypothetical protein